MAKNRHLKILLTGCNSRATVFTKGIPSSEGMPMAGRTVARLHKIFNQMRAVTRSLPGFGIRTLNNDQ